MSNVHFFDDPKTLEKEIGGKALVLSQLLQKKLPVPDGLVLSELPNDEEWANILDWWKSNGKKPIAVRSSACGEDSSELSYAGQQKTFLNVSDEDELKESIKKCFDSANEKNSVSYREHFSQAPKIKMNVALQLMIDPLFAGVFFSKDPRGTDQFFIEFVYGLGEKLVSGEVNPYKIGPDENHLPEEWVEEWTEKVIWAGRQSETSLNAPVDMEWAIDKEGQFWLLQARPITTQDDQAKIAIYRELRRLENENSKDTVWDGQTFSDWSAIPSEITLDIWKKAFAYKGAFSEALKELGYQGSNSDSEGSLLERVYGRAYIKLNSLEPLFFGEIPYRIEAQPRPHLKFDIHKLNWRVLLRTPIPLWQMLKVSWDLRTQRGEILERSNKQLDAFEKNFPITSDNPKFENYNDKELIELFLTESEKFYSHSLKWPFVMTFLIESTLQSLQIMLQKVVGEFEAKTKLQSWIGSNVHTATKKMEEELTLCAENEELRASFIKTYGHRGPGEMDLIAKRWREDTKGLFADQKSKKVSHSNTSVEEEIAQFGRIKGAAILQEWQILKRLLEAREDWKMYTMKPYSQLRQILLEIDRRFNLDGSIFWLRMNEINQLTKDASNEKMKALRRKRETETLKRVSLPAVISMKNLQELFSETKDLKSQFYQGEGLSIGLTQGTALFVEHPEKVDLNQLPKDLILLAESVDPGWTPLFRHAKAILTERGGVLSHAAIVAREMGIPAISNVKNIRGIPSGSKLWVDGTHGRINLEENNGTH